MGEGITMDDLQMEIKRWSVKAFGRPTGPGCIEGLLKKLNEEVGELNEAAVHGTIKEYLLELADINIIINELASSVGGLLSQYTLKKLNINRNRQWARSENGSFHHIESDAYDVT